MSDERGDFERRKWGIKERMGDEVKVDWVDGVWGVSGWGYKKM